MHHLAIMRKDWRLLPKILSGEKRIESRWYMARYAPWGRIKPGDTVFFKDSGDPVTVRAEVEKVLQFENYSESQLRDILDRYAGVGGICFVNPKEEVFEWARKRKYCILIFLKNPRSIPPFHINKQGFGNAVAWICVDDIGRIKGS